MSYSNHQTQEHVSSSWNETGLRITMQDGEVQDFVNKKCYVYSTKLGVKIHFGDFESIPSDSDDKHCWEFDFHYFKAFLTMTSISTGPNSNNSTISPRDSGLQIFKSTIDPESLTVDDSGNLQSSSTTNSYAIFQAGDWKNVRSY